MGFYFYVIFLIIEGVKVIVILMYFIMFNLLFFNKICIIAPVPCNTYFSSALNEAVSCKKCHFIKIL